MMDSIDDSVLSTDLGDVETDTMSPLAAPTNEVSELEQEAEALGTVSMESDEANESEDTTSQGKTIASREDLRSGGGGALLCSRAEVSAYSRAIIGQSKI